MSIVSDSNRGSRSSPKHKENVFISKPAITFQRLAAAARPTAVDSTLSAELIHLTGRTFTSSGFQWDKTFINPQNSDGKIVFLFLVKSNKEGTFLCTDGLGLPHLYFRVAVGNKLVLFEAKYSRVDQIGYQLITREISYTEASNI